MVAPANDPILRKLNAKVHRAIGVLDEASDLLMSNGRRDEVLPSVYDVMALLEKWPRDAVLASIVQPPVTQ